jgi:hypothetical protein
MALTSNKLAILTARFGAARFGASRFGFTPRDTVRPSVPAVDMSASYYVWARVYPATTSWAAVKR